MRTTATAQGSPPPLDRRRLLELLATGRSHAEAAVELDTDSATIRALIKTDGDLREAVKQRRKRLGSSAEEWEKHILPLERLSIEKCLEKGNVTVLNTILRASLKAEKAPSLTSAKATRKDELNDPETPEHRRRFLQRLRQFSEYTPRDIAQWWWLEVHNGTPGVARRLLPDRYPDRFAEALEELAEGLEVIPRIRAEALKTADSAVATAWPGDDQIYPDLYGLRDRRITDEERKEREMVRKGRASWARSGMAGNTGTGAADTRPPLPAADSPDAGELPLPDE